MADEQKENGEWRMSKRGKGKKQGRRRQRKGEGESAKGEWVIGNEQTVKGKGKGKKAEEILLREKSEGVKGLWDREKIIGKEEWAMIDEQKGEWPMADERWAMGDGQ